ncbi:MAG: hypothetical protein JWP12_3331 [Bacteroidetes bacterium]|nr:hypothetical protein [Bacteroidota bacterium]
MLLLCAVGSFAQAPKKGKNLIPNPGFEDHKGKGADIKTATPWKGAGTVDYFLKPEKRDTSRFKGARTGSAYAGLRFQSDYKEYMYVKLLEPLEKDRVYHFKMYVRLLEASNVTVTIKQLGAYFSDVEFKIGMEFDESGLVDTTYNKGISGSLNWILIQGDYTAHGGEKYAIIGNFRTKMKDDFVKKNKWSLFEFKEAYYYIDDVSLRKKLTAADTAKIKTPAVKEPPITYPETYTVGETVLIDKIQFENNSAQFLKISYKSLDALVNALNNHPFMEIQIIGYTDNVGNEAVNRKLSKDRAKAVYDYLLEQGVINPLTYKGVGPANPVAPNDTEENRAKNRRVEFVIISQ